MCCHSGVWLGDEKELWGTGRPGTDGVGACLGTAPRIMTACEPGEQGPGQCVCVGEHWQHSLRTLVRGGGSWHAGCTVPEPRLVMARSHPGERLSPSTGCRGDGAGLLRVSHSLRRPGHRWPSWDPGSRQGW